MHAHLLALLPLLATFGPVLAHPITGSVSLQKREVPQEHSHEKILTSVRTALNMNNPAGIVDPVFGLLGNAAAAAGQGSITDTDCLQQATADQAFTNAKAAGSVDLMAAALQFRALERNTGSVGLASVLCTETPVNAEIAAITQHQDPASTNAAATNKAIVLALAQQLSAIGADPQLALETGTFAPGSTSDPTGAGNTCDDANDPTGCIFTQNLLVEDATAAEISAAVSGGPVAATDVATASGTTSTATCTAATKKRHMSHGRRGSILPKRQTAGIDVGPCTDFSMVFAAGLDGRAATEFSFEPSDLTNFNHGTALNPDIIAQFMCDTFVNACAKSATTRDTCKTVEADLLTQLNAGTLTKDQAYADAWLSGLENAFGIQSTGTGTGTGSGAAADTSTDTSSGTGQDTACDDAATATATATPTAAATSSTAAAAAVTAVATGTASSSSSSSAFAVGQNVNTFTGSLNGAAPVAVTFVGGDRSFEVNGDTFVNEGAAIQRACSVQNNACADAFNSGSGTSSVGDCNAQETQCNAQ